MLHPRYHRGRGRGRCPPRGPPTTYVIVGAWLINSAPSERGAMHSLPLLQSVIQIGRAKAQVTRHNDMPRALNYMTGLKVSPRVRDFFS